MIAARHAPAVLLMLQHRRAGSLADLFALQLGI
jgi:hypothetical protein